MNPDARQEDTVEADGGRRAMEGLRTIWQATGQMQEEFVRLECSSEGDGCATSLSFEGLVDDGQSTADTADALTRLRSAWKTTLAREGKLHDPDTSPVDAPLRPQEKGGGRPE